jgi:hypothetical protein
VGELEVSLAFRCGDHLALATLVFRSVERLPGVFALQNALQVDRIRDELPKHQIFTPLRLSIDRMFWIALLYEGVELQNTGPCGVVTHTCDDLVRFTLKPLAFRRLTILLTSRLATVAHHTIA